MTTGMATQTDKAIKTTCIISSAIGTGLIVGNGPILQAYLTKLITSNEPSIYGSMYGESLASMPEISNWLWSIYTSPATWSAIAIMAVLFLLNKAREIFIGTLVASAISLTLIDLAVNLITPHESMPNMGENLLFNFLGGPLIAAITLGLLQITLFICHGKSYKKPKLLLSASTPLIIATFFSISTYYIASFFYLPIESRLDITVKAPFNANYSTSKNLEKGKPYEFHIFDNNVVAEGNLRIVTPKGDTSTTLKSLDENGTQVAIELLSGCTHDTYLGASKANDKNLILKNVKTLEIMIDKGSSDIFLKDAYGEINLESSNLKTVFIDPTKEKFTASHFITREANSGRQTALNYSPSKPNYKIYFAIPLLRSNENSRTYPSNRQIRIIADSKAYSITFQPQKMLMSQKIECAALGSDLLEKYSHQRAAEINAIGGVLISISNNKADYELNDTYKTSISFKNIDGWAILEDIAKENVNNLISAGMAETLIIQKGITALKVDGIDRAVSGPTTLFATRASFNSYALEPGSMRFYGTAKSAFIDQERINMTRWEKLETSIKIALLSAFGIFLLKISATTYSCIRSNRDIYNSSIVE